MSKEKIKIVASCLIKNNDGKVLAIKFNDVNNELIYIPPGGHYDLGETLQESVIREVKEEVNLTVEEVKLVGVMEKVYSDGVWTFLIYEAVKYSGEVNNNESDEIQKITWIEPEELDSYSNIRWFKE